MINFIKINWIAILIGVSITFLTTTHYTAFRIGRTIGESETLRKLDDANELAGENAELWRGNYRSCIERGGVYSFERNRCDK